MPEVLIEETVVLCYNKGRYVETVSRTAQGWRKCMEQKNMYEKVILQPDVGFDIRFVTMNHNSPFHWHRELELLYILNGHATVTMDGEQYELEPLDAIVMDYAKIHEVLYAMPQTMGICIHISRQLLRRYVKESELIAIRCAGTQLLPEQQTYYSEICECLKEITVLYVNQRKTYHLRSTALILNILASLIEHFSEPVTKSVSAARVGNMERLEQICDYVEHHYREEIILQDAADELGLNREYFCRFFKQSTGTSFIKYVNQVRINHIYQDLLHTDEGVQDIMEHHGFYNQKLFYRMFKERYDCTPRELRCLAQNNPYV